MGGPGPLSDAGKKLLGTAVSACPKPEDNVVADGAGFTYGDVHNLLASYYGYNINEHIEPAQDPARDGVLTSLFMNAIPGSLCVKDLGPRANRLLADRIDDTCEGKVLTGEGAAEKCDALYSAVDARAEEPGIWSWATPKWAALGALGLVVGGTLTGAGFHMGAKLVEGAMALRSVAPGAVAGAAVTAPAVAAAAVAAPAVAGVAAEVGTAVWPVIAVVGAFAGGLAVGYALDKGAANMLDIKSADGDSSLSGWYADEAANLTPRSAQLMIHDIAAWF